MSSETDYIKCKFCNWKRAKWRENSKGELKGTSTAFYVLKEHIYEFHPKEYEAIYKKRAGR